MPEIPNFNDPEYEELIDVLQAGSCIFFGAGISRLAGYKLWRELAIEMIERFWRKRPELPSGSKFDYSLKESLKTHASEIEILEYLFQLQSSLFQEEIKAIFAEDGSRINQAIYYHLSKLNNDHNFYCTTNLEMEFQKYIGIADSSISIVPNFSNPPKKITYLHGRLDNPESWVLTKKQYIEKYQIERAPCMEFIKNIFSDYSVVFIGYGLREEEILEGIIKSNKKRRHYWIEPSSRGKEDYLRIRSTNLRENYKISLIPYFIDTEGDALIYRVIDMLYDVMAGRSVR